MATANGGAQAKVVHSGATRTRLRMDQDHRHPHQMERLRQRLEQQPNVTGVEVNPSTGSVLVHHDGGGVSPGGIAAVFGDLGVVVQGLEGGDAGKSDTARAVETALGDLNRRVAEATGGTFDLKIIVPGGFLALGLWQLATDVGSFFTAIPGYVLVYYAFDTYTKLHHLPSAPPQTQEAAAAGASGGAAG